MAFDTIRRGLNTTRYYNDTLNQVCEKLGILPRNLEKITQRKIRKTAECLTPEEWRSWRNLPETRLLHIQSCGLCAKMVSAIIPIPKRYIKVSIFKRIKIWFGNLLKRP